MTPQELHRARIERYIAAGLSVSGGKGGDSATGAALQNSGQLQQILMNSFKSQFAKQSGVLNLLTSTLTSQLTNPQGYTPAEMAALNSGAINTTAGQYQNALKTVQANEAAKGGNGGLPSGVEEQIQGQLTGQAANETSQLLEQNQVNNANLEQANYWNAISGLGGVANAENPLSYASNATGAANSVAELQNAETQANQSQLLGALGGIVGGAGTALGGYLKGH